MKILPLQDPTNAPSTTEAYTLVPNWTNEAETEQAVSQFLLCLTSSVKYYSLVPLRQSTLSS